MQYRTPWGRPLWGFRAPAAPSRPSARWGEPALRDLRPAPIADLRDLRPAPTADPRGLRPPPAAPKVEAVEPPAVEPPPPIATDARAALKAAMDELDATKGRLERDALRAEEATRGRLVSELIPVLDNLDRTIEAGSPDAALLQGVELVRSQLERVLGSYGLERIAALGARFNPAQHEAVAIAPVVDAAKDGMVTDVISRGYRLAGRVLVPARVRVGKLGEPPLS